MKTFLVPTDFSENADHAIHYAIGLAQHTQGRIILFHNSDIPLSYSSSNLFAAGDMAMGTDPLVPGTGLANPDMEKIYQDKLEQQAAKYRQQAGNTIPISTQFLWGSLLSNLNQIIKKEGVDLVVMGTKGASSFLDRLMGTTTASVLQEAHQAVLAVPLTAQFKIPRHLAYAVDLEHEQEAFLAQALAFASTFNATLTLVHVNSKAREMEEELERFRTRIQQQFPERTFQLVSLQEDKVVPGLENYIRENQPDLIAVGIYERSYLEDLFHSSVSEKLAYHTAIPLLALPEKPYFPSRASGRESSQEPENIT